MSWDRFDEKLLEWYMRFTLVFGFAFTVVTFIGTFLIIMMIPIGILFLAGLGIWIGI